MTKRCLWAASLCVVLLAGCSSEAPSGGAPMGDGESAGGASVDGLPGSGGEARDGRTSGAVAGEPASSAGLKVSDDEASGHVVPVSPADGSAMRVEKGRLFKAAGGRMKDLSDRGCRAAPRGVVGGVRGRPVPIPGQGADGFDGELAAGTLTAGSFDDAAEPKPFLRFLDTVGRQTPFGELAGKLDCPPVVLVLRDAKGRPVAGAQVRLADGSGSVELATRTDGRCVLLPKWDELDTGVATKVEVRVGDLPAQTRELMLTAGTHKLTVEAGGSSIDRLDLAFVVDCTGSMSDELEYLKVEIRGIAERLAKRFPGVEQRYALVCYRDVSDEYVSRSYDFGDLASFRAKLGEQSANGGGDYAEAVDKALEAASHLSWRRDRGTARVVFHVADAPPHPEKVAPAFHAANAMRRNGVAIYPVASSGIEDVAELTMRTEALMTGSLYCFLTDDSGVGDSHAEPHFPHYHVERLNGLIVRCVASELAGKRLAPNRQEIIRTVGQ